ncbi:hypothetical protein IZY60_14730 [Lutibacter sp. B2]|nr:hypothetical protein [Lutibacter sp. B2]
MEQRYVIRTKSSVSESMTRENAIKEVKKYDQQGISAYIVSEEEEKRIENSKFNTPKWS